MTGESFKLTVNSDDKIWEVKLKIRERNDISSSDSIQLIFNEKVLPHNQKVSQTEFY